MSVKIQYVKDLNHLKFNYKKSIKKYKKKNTKKIVEIARMGLKASMYDLWSHLFILSPGNPHSMERFQRAQD